MPEHTVGVAFYLIFVGAGLAGAVVMFKLLRGIKLI
ncbi:MAG: cytochrome B6 [Cyanobacteria bacterium MAG IRC4_bin_6]|nr:cytochrome B6 [Cyanobacteria bacterium MAG IRC3_bin_20]MDE0646492.1 cytochrome B6 [Cyanobacteria bacterium MAG IRC4_bin_6]